MIHTLNKASLMDHFIGLIMNLKDCQGLRVRERKEKKTIFRVSGCGEKRVEYIFRSFGLQGKKKGKYVI